jgi:hypothetical protein
VITQEMNPSLSCPQTSCAPTSFERRTELRAGGAAYDSRLSGLWVTNGNKLACIDVGGCKYLCYRADMPLPSTTTKVWCTGLAYVDSGAKGSNAASPGWLFASYSDGSIGRLDVSSCSVTAQFCKFSVSGVTIGGLASDDVTGHLFVGTTSTDGANVVYVTAIDPTSTVPRPWGKAICSFTPTNCSSTSKLGPIEGLAYNSHTKVLYITDGKQTSYAEVTGAPTSCAITHVGCCPLKVDTAGDTFSGICLRPPPAASDGNSCTGGGCNKCDSVMIASTVGDAVLGNPAFAMALWNAPSDTETIALAVNAGGCTSPGINLGHCGNVLVPLLPSPIVFVFGVPPVSGTCDRNLLLPVPLPLNTRSSGVPYSFQFLVRCGGKPEGFGLSNCVTFWVTSQ